MQCHCRKLGRRHNVHTPVSGIAFTRFVSILCLVLRLNENMLISNDNKHLNTFPWYLKLLSILTQYSLSEM